MILTDMVIEELKRRGGLTTGQVSSAVRSKINRESLQALIGNPNTAKVRNILEKLVNEGRVALVTCPGRKYYRRQLEWELKN